MNLNPKILTESGWKEILQKSKLKDNGLQRALNVLENENEKSPAEAAKALSIVIQLASALKKGKEVAGQAGVAKYLAEMLTAAVAQQREFAKKAVEAQKASVLEAATARQQKDAEAEQDEQDEQGADFGHKLLNALLKLRSSKDLVYEFIVCDAKPHCGLMLARKITGKEKEELAKVTGSKHFPHTGTCRVVDGKFSFTTDQPGNALAKKLQDAIRNYTGKKFPIAVGNESVDDDESQPQAQPAASAKTAGARVAAPTAPIPPPRLGQAALGNAPEVWHGTRSILDNNINHLKQAIRNEYATDGPEMLANIERTVSKLDVILQKLDQRLADSLAKAATTNDPASRATELKNSKAILTDYLKYVKGEALIAHIDANPLGIQTNIKQLLTESLTHMARAIG